MADIISFLRSVDTKIKNIAGGVYIKIDGKLYPTVYGTHREDVARNLKVPAYRDSGFEVSIPVSEIGAGQHTITVITLTKDRKAYYMQKTGEIIIQTK